MEIIKITANQPIIVDKKSVAAIGYFDGIHKGHQALIEEVLKQAGNLYVSSVICFDNDPHLLLHKVNSPRYITPHNERLSVLKAMGIQRCFLLHFDEIMMNMSKERFIHDILDNLSLKALICGEDFRFAIHGEGNIHTLSNQSFILKVIKEKRYLNHKISSSAIEILINEGKMQECFEQLGRFYSIKGTIIHGSNVGGNQLGFPTANLQMNENYIIPKRGVYAGSVQIKENYYKAMINVGNNPTMNYQMNTSIEAHIIDFNEDIYGDDITFYFHDYMRDEKKFNTTEALIEQLNIDVNYVKNL